MRLRMFNQYASKLIERFPEIKLVIEKKMEMICQIWNDLEARFIGYLDEDFDQIVQGLLNNDQRCSPLITIITFYLS